MAIHPSAHVEQGATIDPAASIGAFCFVGKDVTLGKVTLMPHAVIEGKTTIEDGVSISSFACVGGLPQISDFDESQAGSLHIGKDTIIREYATINVGSAKGGGITTIGEGCLLMISSHIAHDCRVGDRVIIANDVALGGHVEIGDHAVIGGLCGIHQRVRIGHHAMVGFLSAVDKDVIPYGLVMPQERAHLQHLNWRRLGEDFSHDKKHAAKKLFDEIFKSEGELYDNAENLLAQYKGDEFAEDILQFILGGKHRKIATPKRHP